MLMQRTHETVETGGMGAGNTFTIAASAKAFEILSSNLYQNKILAVIRETVCNAVDAHAVMGKPVSDIEVHLPTFHEPYFAVRDFGPGLSLRDATTLYTTYFQSTKDTDVSLIGGFGLGSKAPFAVADQFTVTAWHGGTKNTYVCYKQDGFPRVNQVGSESCGTETGLEVRVAVKSNTGHDWISNARDMFRWWPELPRFNVEFISDDAYRHSDNLIVESERSVDGMPAWALYKQLPGSQAIVMMGKVPYHLSLSAIPSLPDAIANLLRTCYFKMVLPIGAVEISPSREALSYSPDTCKILIAEFERIIGEVRDQLDKMLADASSLTEARRFLYSPSVGGSPHGISLMTKFFGSSATLRWQGKLVEQSARLDLGAHSSPITVTNYEKRSNWKAYQRTAFFQSEWFHTYSRNGQFRILVWTDKVTAKTYQILKHNYNPTNYPNKSVVIYIFSGVPYAELVAACDEVGIPTPLHIYNDLAAPAATPGAKGGATKNPATQFYVMGQRAHGGSWTYTLSQAPLDMKGGGYYVHFDRGDPVLGSLHKLYATLDKQGWLTGPMKRVIGISKARLKDSSKLKQVLTANGWALLDFSVISACLDNAKVLEHAQLEVVKAWRVHPLGSAGYTVVELASNDALAGKVWPGFQDLWTLLEPHQTVFRSLRGLSYCHNLSTAADMAPYCNAATSKALIEIAKQGTELQSAYRKFVDCHPLLGRLASDASPSIEELRSYVNR